MAPKEIIVSTQTTVEYIQHFYTEDTYHKLFGDTLPDGYTGPGEIIVEGRTVKGHFMQASDPHPGVIELKRTSRSTITTGPAEMVNSSSSS